MQDCFNELIKSYRGLSLEDKKRYLIKDIKEMIAVYVDVAETYNIPVELLKSKEVLDIQDNECSEEDYIEALFVYINVLKEISSRIINETIDKI